MEINSKLVLIKVKSSGNTDKPELDVELKFNETISNEDKQLAEEVISYIFNLDFDLSPFYEDMKNDKIMLTVTQMLFGLKNPTTLTIFEFEENT